MEISALAPSDREISTHAPRTGSDSPRRPFQSQERLFQPTLPARGATRALQTILDAQTYFNPRSPHGERQKGVFGACFLLSEFQPTLPARGATFFFQRLFAPSSFQPTLPARGATTSPISSGKSTTYFNPRSPHGERLANSVVDNPHCDFNPRSPHGERPTTRLTWWSESNFNPRSPHGERPTGSFQWPHCLRYFNPRSPHGERPAGR